MYSSFLYDASLYFCDDGGESSVILGHSAGGNFTVVLDILIWQMMRQEVSHLEEMQNICMYAIKEEDGSTIVHEMMGIHFTEMLLI